MAEVTDSLRALLASMRWTAKQPEIAANSFIACYASNEQDQLRNAMTADTVHKILSEMPKKNPVMTGMTVGTHPVQLRLDNVRDIANTAEMAAVLISTGFSFPEGKDPEDNIIFYQVSFTDITKQEDQQIKRVKATVTVINDQRAVDAVSGARPLFVDGYMVVTLIFTPIMG
eukprot:834827-Rhodomonas_salina.1